MTGLSVYKFVWILEVARSVKLDVDWRVTRAVAEYTVAMHRISSRKLTTHKATLKI
jgi:hypothetical protein